MTASPTQRPDALPSPDLQAVLRATLDLQLRETIASYRAYRQRATAGTLHDMRTAIRQTRLLLTVCARVLPHSPGANSAEPLRELARKLGPLRDLDVIGQGLHRRAIKNPELAPLLDQLRPRLIRDRNTARRVLKQSLASPDWGALERRMFEAVDDVDQGRLRHGSSPERQAWARQQIRQAIRRVRRFKKHAGSADSETLHDLRIRLRKIRLLNEALTPTLTAKQKRLVPRLRAAEKVLGKLHDLDMTLDWVRGGSETRLHPLVRHLEARREKTLHTFRDQWKELPRSFRA